MLLAVDIGNSNIDIGVFDGEALRLRVKLAANTERSADEYAVLISNLFQIHAIPLSALTDCILASVVPGLTGLVADAVLSLIGRPPMQVGPGVRTGFPIRIDDPSQLGADLAADTAAALAEYGAPCILIDAGTVTTIAAVDQNRTYLGGCILPGIRGSADLLKAATALLPSIELHSGKEPPIGKNSADAMRIGLLAGHTMAVEGFLRRFSALPGMENAKCIATGGSAPLITSRCALPITFDRDLTLKGLRYIYQLNQKKRG